MRNLILLASLLIAAPAAADSFGAIRRLVLTCQTSAPAPINTDRVWTKCSNKHLMHTDSTNVDTDLHAAGGGGSVDGLKSAFEAASSTAQNIVASTSSLGVATFRDDGATETGIFRAQDSSGAWDMVRADNLDQGVTLATGFWGYGATPYLDATGGNITSRNTAPASGGAPVQVSTTSTQLGAGYDGAASRRVGTYVYGTASATGSAAYAAEAHYGVFRAGVGHDGVVVSRNNAATTTTVSGLAATSATLTTPVINGATSASGNFDLSGSSGTMKTTTGAVTIGPGAVTLSGNMTTNGFVGPSYGGTSTNVSSPTWTAPTLLNSCVNYGSSFEEAGYFKDALGIVHIKGVVKSCTSINSVIFTLPAGYRPTSIHWMASTCSDTVPALAVVRINTNGDVLIGNNCSSTSLMSLENVHFMAAQ